MLDSWMIAGYEKRMGGEVMFEPWYRDRRSPKRILPNKRFFDRRGKHDRRKCELDDIAVERRIGERRGGGDRRENPCDETAG